MRMRDYQGTIWPNRAHNKVAFKLPVVNATQDPYERPPPYIPTTIYRHMQPPYATASSYQPPPPSVLDNLTREPAAVYYAPHQNNLPPGCYRPTEPPQATDMLNIAIQRRQQVQVEKKPPGCGSSTCALFLCCLALCCCEVTI
ncbi:hypothetical protein FA15DRAFT_670193 [Coprinopsis marcescibilis]|uniref:Uncharacterized protein n=1 Tax=Coprinopsis marcescibilis TaxID=230819 RepID=A0A5C3KT13_COPMA|nr:hypothetical protein FA15DRAFT_670193 [Coprinopsis marcescibilis]